MKRIALLIVVGLVVVLDPAEVFENFRRDLRRQFRFATVREPDRFDPERFLNWLYKYTGWFFRWPMVVCVLLLALCALTLVAVNFDEFHRKLPALAFSKTC